MAYVITETYGYCPSILYKNMSPTISCNNTLDYNLFFPRVYCQSLSGTVKDIEFLYKDKLDLLYNDTFKKNYLYSPKRVINRDNYKTINDIKNMGIIGSFDFLQSFLGLNQNVLMFPLIQPYYITEDEFFEKIKIKEITEEIKQKILELKPNEYDKTDEEFIDFYIKITKIKFFTEQLDRYYKNLLNLLIKDLKYYLSFYNYTNIIDSFNLTKIGIFEKNLIFSIINDMVNISKLYIYTISIYEIIEKYPIVRPLLDNDSNIVFSTDSFQIVRDINTIFIKSIKNKDIKSFIPIKDLIQDNFIYYSETFKNTEFIDLPDYRINDMYLEDIMDNINNNNKDLLDIHYKMLKNIRFIDILMKKLITIDYNTINENLYLNSYDYVLPIQIASSILFIISQISSVVNKQDLYSTFKYISTFTGEILSIEDLNDSIKYDFTDKDII